MNCSLNVLNLLEWSVLGIVNLRVRIMIWTGTIFGPTYPFHQGIQHINLYITSLCTNFMSHQTYTLQWNWQMILTVQNVFRTLLAHTNTIFGGSVPLCLAFGPRCIVENILGFPIPMHPPHFYLMMTPLLVVITNWHRGKLYLQDWLPQRRL